MCPAHATAKGLCSRAWRSVSTRPAAPGEGAGGARGAGVPGGAAAGGEVPAGAPGGARDPWLRCALPEWFSSPLRASPALSHLLPPGCRCGCDTGWRSCPGSASPRAAPRRHRGWDPRSSLPIAAPSPPASRPLPAVPRCPCPAPSPPAGVMLGGPRASSGGLRYPRVNHPRYRGGTAVRTPQ